MSAVDIVVRGAKQQVGNVIDFVTTPVGPFETVDKMVKNTRNTARSLLRQVGVRAPERIRGLRFLR